MHLHWPRTKGHSSLGVASAGQPVSSEARFFTPVRYNNTARTSFWWARLPSVRKYPLNRQWGGSHCVCPSCHIVIILTQRQKRCSLTESLWKLGLGSVHLLLNLWDKCVLTTTTCKLHSLFIFRTFPYGGGVPIFKCGYTLYYSWVPLEVSSDGNDTKVPS